MLPKVSIIVPVKNNKTITRTCLDSIYNYTDKPQVIIVNDGSDADTAKMLKSYKKAIYIENEISQGWCKAVNQGLEKATGQFVVFSNNDIVVTPDWFKEMKKHFDADRDLGVLGPTSSKVEGYQSVDFNKEGVDFQYADVVTFFFVMIKRGALNKIGKLDERFGLGGQDDADFCIRARQAEFKVGIARNVFIYHYGSATFRGVLDNNVTKSQEFAKSRVDILRDKYRDTYDTGVKKRIMICIPSSSGKIVSELVSLLIYWSHDSRYVIQLYMPKGMFPLDSARNHCVNEFLKTNNDYLLWIDDDIVPPIDGLEKLLKADKDIIGGVGFAMKYENGIGFPYPVTLRYNEEKKYIAYYGEGVEECDATGGAFILFKRKVYEEMDKPYEFHYYRNGTLSLTCDFDIHQKAQKAGFKLFIDFSVICDHIRTASLKSVQNCLAVEKDRV